MRWTNCEVTLNDPECEGTEWGHRPVRCYACGNKVCRKCSGMAARYLTKRNVRVCLDCQEDRAEDITMRPTAKAVAS